MIVAALLALGAADVVGAATVVEQSCDAGDASTVVVCGRRDRESPYRLPKLSERYQPSKIRAETGLGKGVRASAAVTSVDLPGGQKSNRAMITIRTAF